MPNPTASTTTTASTVVLTQAICKPLYDAVSRHAKSPMLSHTLQRTFSPLLQAMEGPPITYVSKLIVIKWYKTQHQSISSYCQLATM